MPPAQSLAAASRARSTSMPRSRREAYSAAVFTGSGNGARKPLRYNATSSSTAGSASSGVTSCIVLRREPPLLRPTAAARQDRSGRLAASATRSTQACSRCLADSVEYVVDSTTSPRTPVTVPVSRVPSPSRTSTSYASGSSASSAPQARATASAWPPISAMTRSASGPGGSVPPCRSRSTMADGACPASRRRSTRSPIAHFCRESSSIGRASSGSCPAHAVATPSRWRRNPFAGC